MSGALDGRVAVVTGGAQGLGLGYARLLLDQGASVAVVDRAEDATRAAVERLGADAPGRVHGVVCDVTDADAVGDMAAEVTSALGAPGVLVTNAGGAILPSAPTETFALEGRWERVLDVNLTAQWRCATALVPAMRQAGYGKVVMVSSTMVGKGWPLGLSAYTAAKAGVIGLVRALAREWGPDGVRVNGVAPGYVPVDTPKEVHRSDAEPALRARIAADQCVPVTLTPDDLAGPVAFLAGPASDGVTGQVLAVDNGWTYGT